MILACILFLAGCKRQAPEAEVAKEKAADLASGFGMAEAPATQLTHGFHAVENGWRWVESKFGVTLAPPESSNAQLELKFSVPAAVTDRMGAVTLTATVNGKALSPETYAAPGSQVYVRDLGAIGPGPVTVEFSTDKALPPGGVDTRELALIVTHVGLK
jgi:hypothetical protein